MKSVTLVFKMKMSMLEDLSTLCMTEVAASSSYLIKEQLMLRQLVAYYLVNY